MKVLPYIPILILGLMRPADKPPQFHRLDLVPVYQYEADNQVISPRAYFSSDGQFVYLQHWHKPRVTVIDWKNQVAKAEVDFSHLPCGPSKNPRYNPLAGLYPFPGGGFTLLRYCNAVYVLASQDLKVVARLVDGENHNGLGWAVSKSGRTLAIGVYDKQAATSELWIYEIPHWDRPQALAISTGLGLALSSDGAVVAVRWFENVPGGKITERIGVDLYDTKTGKLVKRLFSFRPNYEGSPHDKLFLLDDGKRLLISGVLVEGRYVEGRYGVSLWDVESGKLVRVIHDEKNPELITVSPGERLVVVDVRPSKGRPIRAPTRDYRIWDLETGQLLYESPEYRPDSSASAYLRANYGATVQFSPDGQFLLEVIPGKKNKLTIYRIQRE